MADVVGVGTASTCEQHGLAAQWIFPAPLLPCSNPGAASVFLDTTDPMHFIHYCNMHFKNAADIMNPTGTKSTTFQWRLQLRN